MPRLLLAAVLLAFTAPAAHAATLAMGTDSSVYNGGDTVHLFVIVTADAGEESSAVFGKISLISDGGGTPLIPLTQSPALLETAGAPWTLGALPCDATSCTLMNQFQATPGPV